MYQLIRRSLSTHSQVSFVGVQLIRRSLLWVFFVGLCCRFYCKHTCKPALNELDVKYWYRLIRGCLLLVSFVGLFCRSLLLVSFVCLCCWSLLFVSFVVLFFQVFFVAFAATNKFHVKHRFRLVRRSLLQVYFVGLFCRSPLQIFVVAFTATHVQTCAGPPQDQIPSFQKTNWVSVVGHCCRSVLRVSLVGQIQLLTLV